MAGHAEGHVVLLIFHQHPRVRPGVRLVAGQAIDRLQNLVHVRRVHDVADRVLVDRVTVAVLNRQQNHFAEIVFRQLYLAVEDRDQVLTLKLLWIRIGPVALQAELAGSGGAQQVIVIPAVRLVAGCASLLEGRLMQVGLLHLIGLVAVASQAGLHWIRLQEARRLSSVRIVASGAVALRSRMLHFRGIDRLRLLVVAGHAQRLGVSIGQDNFSVLGRRMARIAHLVFEGIVQERLHQLRLGGFVRTVALQAVRRAEGLADM